MALRLLLTVLLVVPALAYSNDDRPTRVIFFGNSFTYYNNSLHNHYRQLVATQAPDLKLRTRASTISGGYLREHSQLPTLVKAETWDIVVMQDHSRGPLDHSEDFTAAARKFAKVIRARGAYPVLFMTWAYTDAPEMTAQLDKAYSDLGAELDINVAPVGLAFATVTEDRPDIALRTADKIHPTLEGTYLAACVFYTLLHRRSPVGIDYDAGLGKETASYLQGVAARTVIDYSGR